MGTFYWHTGAWSNGMTGALGTPSSGPIPDAPTKVQK